MPVSSQFLTLINQMQTSIQARGLTFNSKAVNVVPMKITEWFQNISLPPLPAIIIAREDSPYAVIPWSTENEVLAKYNVVVLAIAGGNRDNFSNADVWFSWDEQIRRLFQWGMQPIIQSCYFAEVIVNPPVARAPALKNYDVSGQGYKLHNIEQRTN